MSRALLLFMILGLIFSQVGMVSSQLEDRDEIRIVMITHGQEGDQFWDVVKRGVDQAMLDTGVTVEYQTPANFDLEEMAQLIRDAIVTDPDGIIVSIPDVNILGPAIREAVAADIPVISINSGGDVAEDLGVLSHIGQTEFEAGFRAGSQLSASGATFALCLNHEMGNSALDQRCQGFADAMVSVFAQVEILSIDLDNPEEEKERLGQILLNDPSIDALFGLGTPSGVFMLEVLEEVDMLGDVMLATFDVSPEIMEAIQAGNMEFAIDQQQYLQGYLPIVYMTLYIQNRNVPGNFVVQTGPGFITAENVDTILELTQQGLR